MKTTSIITKIFSNPVLVKIGNILIYPFYRKSSGINPYDILFNYFIPQKIFLINGSVPWPVHHSSLVYDQHKIKIGKGVAPGSMPGNYIQGKNGIIFGNNVWIAPGVGIISANHDIDNYHKWKVSPPIEIGNNVWIGMNAVILPGIKIGDNVVIGANSLVNRDIPANTVAAGNPCRVIKEKNTYCENS